MRVKVSRGNGPAHESNEPVLEPTEPIEGSVEGGFSETDTSAAEADVESPGQDAAMDGLWRRLEEKEREAQENYEKYLRSLADFDNIRKRLERESKDSIEFANVDLVLQFLPILDNFQLALQHANNNADYDSLLQGVKQILKQMESTLQKQGVEAIDAVGKMFDPAEHEAVGHMASDEFEEGVVAQDLRTGYRMKGKCIRPAIVRVAGG